MIRKSTVGLALASGLIGFLLGSASSVLLRVVQVTSQAAMPPAENVVDHILYGSDIRQIRAFIQDDPSVVNVAQSGMLPILAAITFEEYDAALIEYLLDVGADPTIASGRSTATLRHSALSYAAWLGDYKLLNLLLNHIRQNPNEFSWEDEVRRAKSIFELEYPDSANLVFWP